VAVVQAAAGWPVPAALELADGRQARAWITADPRSAGPGRARRAGRLALAARPAPGRPGRGGSALGELAELPELADGWRASAVRRAAPLRVVRGLARPGRGRRAGRRPPGPRLAVAPAAAAVVGGLAAWPWAPGPLTVVLAAAGWPVLDALGELAELALGRRAPAWTRSSWPTAAGPAPGRRPGRGGSALGELAELA
jgi:hypothetical protein